jgi:hypothetical protein
MKNFPFTLSYGPMKIFTTVGDPTGVRSAVVKALAVTRFNPDITYAGLVSLHWLLTNAVLQAIKCPGNADPSDIVTVQADKKVPAGVVSSILLVIGLQVKADTVTGGPVTVIATVAVGLAA